jgi:hypothetical protein
MVFSMLSKKTDVDSDFRLRIFKMTQKGVVFSTADSYETKISLMKDGQLGMFSSMLA